MAAARGQQVAGSGRRILVVDDCVDVREYLRDVLGYRLYFDLQRGWRITNPNLEQLDLLKIRYQGLDAGHMLGEARQAMLLQRVGFGPDAMTARQALEIATLGGEPVGNTPEAFASIVRSVSWGAPASAAAQ